MNKMLIAGYALVRRKPQILIIFLFFLPTPLFVLRAVAILVQYSTGMMGKFFLDLVRFVLDRRAGLGWTGPGGGGWSGGTRTVQHSKGQIAKSVELGIGLRREGKVS
ncbi:hypothetical protein B9Z19DRAFT_1092982 [Tuber borchii]|uniref:Uncharacterized protein n=1 Tax=Tuber borchii TaxID=42251 RepID=A0A2T6ZFX3_TUBBO|nr:hypothetical protein B9Z19DRAFT_1092982 [Tuber borchii]